MSTSENINELATALSKAQGATKNATMNRINPHFKSKYADLSSVLDAARAPLAANGLAITQTIEVANGAPLLATTLLHSSGQWLRSEYPLPATAKPHEMGSALTYARRYSLAAIICNSSDEDDDANAATEATKKNGNGAYISPTEAEEIQHRIVDTGSDIAAFCKYLGVPDITHIPASKFQHAKAALDAKAKQS